MIYALLETIATHHPYSYPEVYDAYEKLNSIDAILVAIELANLNDISLAEATEYMRYCKRLTQE